MLARFLARFRRSAAASNADAAHAGPDRAADASPDADDSDRRWPGPWHPLSGERAAWLVAELQREVAATHVLSGVPVRAIARRSDQDDVLYTLLDGSGRVALVHLTWASRRETSPDWPSAELFADLDEFFRVAIPRDLPELDG